MNAKEYLGQAYRIDQRIDNKIKQVESLHELATKATATLSDMPVNHSKNPHSMEDVIVKIVGLENEINADIDELVTTKQNIVRIIKKVATQDYETILEQRYLCFYSWEQIAVNMSFSIQHVFRLHNLALKEISRIMKDESK